jgi:hypothetical protein
MANYDEAGAAAVDYLMYSGYVTLAYLWALMAQVAQQKLAAGEGDAALICANAASLCHRPC